MAYVNWKKEPEDHDYPAAADYLNLVASEADALALVSAIKAAPIVTQKAKDILRASGLALLPADNVHVASDLKKIKRGEALSPILMVRGDLRLGIPAQIADGYHRVCASYHVDENTDIPCRIADLS